MKRIFALSLLLMILAVALAESEQPVILFRDLEWYTPFSVADPIIDESSSSYTTISRYCNIDKIKYVASAYGLSDDYAAEAGIKRKYASVEVAGYTADAVAYFMYSTETGKIDYSDNNSELCMGMYVFQDMVDISATYDDLASKLLALYGNGEMDQGKEFKAIVWTDEIGNRLCIFYDIPVDVVRIAYCPYDLEDRIANFNVLRELDKLEQEEQLREDNAGNTSGL